MSESPFPVFRLVTLLARQASAPIAARIKTYARSHPWFSRRVCMTTGRVYNALELRTKMWMLALTQPRSLPPLSDDKALQDGANILGARRIVAVDGGAGAAGGAAARAGAAAARHRPTYGSTAAARASTLPRRTNRH